MAPTHSFIYFLSLILTYTHLCPYVLARPWIVTDLYQEVPVTDDPYYWETSAAIVTTSIEAITPTVTSLPEALSTITSTDSYYSDVTVIQKLYPTGVGSAVDHYYHYYSDNDYTHTTVYVVNLTFSAPTGCSTQWTTTTAATVYPPSMVRSLLPKTAVSTSTSVDQSEAFRPTTVTYEYVWVDPTQVPSATLSSLSEYNYPSTLYSGSSCAYTGNGYYSGYYDDDDDYNSWFYDSYWMGISPFALTMILLFGWIGLWLILGFIEAWVRFRRLMTGWQTRRGLPVCWSITVLPISLLLLCFFFRKGYRARNAADAAVLKEQWNNMSFWTKLRLFFVWGFRYKYPPMLGPAPARVKASKRPGKNPDEPLINPNQPSMTEAGVQGSRAASAEHSVDMEPGRVAGEQHALTEMQRHDNTAVPEASGALAGNEDGQIGRAH